MGHSPQDRKESDMTERVQFNYVKFNVLWGAQRKESMSLLGRPGSRDGIPGGEGHESAEVGAWVPGEAVALRSGQKGQGWELGRGRVSSLFVHGRGLASGSHQRL